MWHWKNKVAVVTDCDEVGLAIIEKLAKTGMIVISFNKTDIKLEKALERLKPLTSKEIVEKIVLFICDITDTEQLKKVFHKINETYEGVDVLINNAYTNIDCLVTNGDLGNVKKIIELNISALVACTRLAAGKMVERKTRGHIININDMSAYEIPKESLKSVFVATRAAVTSVNEILRHEFRHLKANVKVTNVALGSIEDLEELEMGKRKLKLGELAKLVKLILNTPEHLQVHEVLLEPVDEEDSDSS